MVLNDNNVLYSNLSKGYRAPQASELYQLERKQTVADLAPETASNLEIGLKGNIAALSYILSAYTMDKKQVIFRDSDFFTINDGQSSHRGVEVEFEYAINLDWQIRLPARMPSTNTSLINNWVRLISKATRWIPPRVT